LKSGSFNLQEPSGPVQLCTGIALWRCSTIASLYRAFHNVLRDFKHL